MFSISSYNPLGVSCKFILGSMFKNFQVVHQLKDCSLESSVTLIYYKILIHQNAGAKDIHL